MMMAQQQQRRAAPIIHSFMRLCVVLVLLLGCWPTIQAQPPSSYQDGDDYYNDAGGSPNGGGGYGNDPQNYGDPSYEQEYAQDSLYHDYAARQEQKAAGCVATIIHHASRCWLGCGTTMLRRAVDRFSAAILSFLFLSPTKNGNLYILTHYCWYFVATHTVGRELVVSQRPAAV
jgi:hypothetical protein